VTAAWVTGCGTGCGCTGGLPLLAHRAGCRLAGYLRRRAIRRTVSAGSAPVLRFGFTSFGTAFAAASRTCGSASPAPDNVLRILGRPIRRADQPPPPHLRILVVTSARKCGAACATGPPTQQLENVRRDLRPASRLHKRLDRDRALRPSSAFAARLTTNRLRLPVARSAPCNASALRSSLTADPVSTCPTRFRRLGPHPPISVSSSFVSAVTAFRRAIAEHTHRVHDQVRVLLGLHILASDLTICVPASRPAP